MNNTVSNLNKEILKNNNPLLYESIYLNLPLNRIKVEEKGNNLIVSSDQASCYLNSTYSLEDECKIMFKNMKINTELLILLGIANGVAIDFVKKHHKHIKRIYVLEPTNQIIKTVLKRRALTEWIDEDLEVSLIVNQPVDTAIEMLAGLLESGEISNIHMTVSGAYVSLFPNWCVETMSLFQEYIQHRLLSINTKRYFMHRWPINIFRNLKKKEMNVESLKGTLNSRIGILVSGGPSLEYDLEVLRTVADSKKAVIFAVGSAIKIMDSHEIGVDYRMAIDGNDGQKKIFSQLKNNEIPLIHATSSFHQIVDEYAGPTFQCLLGSDFLAEYVYELAGIPHMSIITGYSVAISALDLMIKLGFQKIILMGQDLSFSDGKHYTSGSWTNEIIENFEEQKKSLTPAINNSGNEVYMNIPFIGMKRAMEELISAHPEVEVINTSRNGVIIEGTTFKLFNPYIIDEVKIEEDDTVKVKIETSPDESELLSVGVAKYFEELKRIQKISSLMLERCKVGLESSEEEGLNELLEIQKLEVQMNELGAYEKTIIPMLRDRLLVISQQSFSNMEDNYKKDIMRVISAMSEVRFLIDFYLELIAEFNGEKTYNVIYED